MHTIVEFFFIDLIMRQDAAKPQQKIFVPDQCFQCVDVGFIHSSSAYNQFVCL